MNLTQSTIEDKWLVSNRINFGEKDHAIREMGHSKKRCFRDSVEEPQRGHWRKSNSSLNPITSLVGRAFHIIFQSSSLSLSWIFNFHNIFHSCLVRGPIVLNQDTWLVQKADLVEKAPLLLGDQISTCGNWPSWILWMWAIDSSSKNSFSKSSFHLLGSSWIKSKTQFRRWRLLRILECTQM